MIENCLIFVDAHVHFHKCFRLSSFLDSAVENFRQAMTGSGFSGERKSFMLLFSESSGVNCYQKLAELADGNNVMPGSHHLDWRFKRTGETEALQACRSDDREIYLLAGRQIVTSEKLEVLALITKALFEGGRPLAQTVDAVHDCGGIPVIPWGFGKWIGKRGRILEKFLMDNEGPVFLGDNSGRPSFWPRPKLFDSVESAGGRVVPGSDPLPFVSEMRKAGSFGFYTRIPFNPVLPGASLKQILNDPAFFLQPYGRLEHPLKFLANQFLMQARKRKERAK